MLKITLLAAILFSLSCYLPINRRKAKYYWNIDAIDRKIPLIPVFIFPYGSYFIFMAFGTYMLSSTEIFQTYLINFLLLIVSFSIFWIVFPNGVTRPKFKADSPLKKLVKLIYKTDHDTNGLPSGHVGYTFLICYYYFFVYPQAWWVLVWSGLIVVSTLFLKQHYFIDVITTPFFVITSILLVQIML